MEIYLIRHTSLAIESGICYGQSDVKVANSFLDEVELIKQNLPKNLPIYTSPLSRCLDLSEELTNNEVYIDNRLMELNFGNWEMKRWDNIDQDEIQPWYDDFVNVSCPGGESYYNLFQRSVECYRAIISSNSEKIGIISHGGVIRSILAYVHNVPLKDSFEEFKIDYGEVIKLQL